MKTINAFFCLIFLVALQPALAQDESRIGGLLAYGTEIQNLGIGVNAEFPIAGKLTIAPSFIFYLPKDEAGVKINWFEVNGNVNYYFVDQDGLGVYGLGGLNYSSVKVSAGGYSISDGQVGLNLGAGANFDIGSSVLPFAELKYVIMNGGQLVLAAGVKFSL